MGSGPSHPKGREDMICAKCNTYKSPGRSEMFDMAADDPTQVYGEDEANAAK